MTYMERMRKNFPRKVMPHSFLIPRGLQKTILSHLEAYIGNCPNCGNQVKRSLRCPRCGQALDWEDGE